MNHKNNVLPKYGHVCESRDTPNMADAGQFNHVQNKSQKKSQKIILLP